MPGPTLQPPPTGFDDLIPPSGGVGPTGFEDLIPPVKRASPSPSLGQQVVEGGQDVVHAVEHPWQTLKGLGTSALGNLRDAFSDKVIGTVPGMQTVSPNEQLQIEKSLGQPLPRVTAQTPGAITPKRALLGVVNTASLPAFALAPTLALPARVAVNAGLGALNNLEEPMRGAIGGAALGEVFHGATELPEAVGRAANVVPDNIMSSTFQDPVLRAQINEPPPAAQDGLPFRTGTTRGLALARAETIANRSGAPTGFEDLIPDEEPPVPAIKFTEGRAAAALPPEPPKVLSPSDANAQPSQLVLPDQPTPSHVIPVVPAPTPTTVPLYDRFGTSIEESPNQPTGTFDAKGIGRRPVAELPLEQQPPIEPGPDAQTVSYGGRVGRRPGGAVPEDVDAVESSPTPTGFEDLIPPAPPVEPPPTAETVSAGGPPESTQAPRLSPVVSASHDAIDARPGVIQAANKAIPDEPPTRTPVPPPSVGRGNVEDVTGTQSFEGVQPPTPVTPAPTPRASDILNVAKLNLEDKTAQQRVADQLEQFRTQREQEKQTFSEADVNRKAIVNELLANDPKALSPAAAGKLSGEELLARRDVVNQNDQLIGDLSKSIESGQLSPEEHEQASQLLNKAVEHNDALLSDLVTGSSQKGRDLNLLRRMANTSLDADVWMVQAKRMLGDQPMTDDVMSSVRKLVNAAKEACGG